MTRKVTNRRFCWHSCRGEEPNARIGSQRPVVGLPDPLMPANGFVQQQLEVMFGCDLCISDMISRFWSTARLVSLQMGRSNWLLLHCDGSSTVIFIGFNSLPHECRSTGRINQNSGPPAAGFGLSCPISVRSVRFRSGRARRAATRKYSVPTQVGVDLFMGSNTKPPLLLCPPPKAISAAGSCSRGFCPCRR